MTVVGILTPDGTGNFVEDYSENVSGTTNAGSNSGTYTVNANCTVTLTFSNSQTAAGVIVSKGAEVDLMSTTTGVVETEVMKKIGL